MVIGGLIYEDPARYDGWTRAVLWGVVAILLAAGVALLFVDTDGAYPMLAAAVLVGLLLWAIMPRQFQVYEDRVRLVLGGPFAWTIPLRDIKTVGVVPGSRGFIYHGVRFVTSLRSVVEVKRHRGMDVVFSPLHADEFIEQIDRARDMLPK
jgi:hypothetical protein